MDPLPRRMRERIVALYEQGVPTKRIADGLGTSRSGTRRIRQNLRQRGTLEPRRSKTGYASGLTPGVAGRLRDLVAAEPGATRAVLRDRLGVTVDVRTVGRWLAKLGLVLEKKSLRAAEQDRPDVKAARDVWHDTLAGVSPDKLVFVDESGARTNMTRLYGWGAVGERVIDPVPHGHWKTCTMLAAVRLSGPLAAVTIDAAVNADAFRLWTREVLVPCLSPGDVVVMDNLAAHKAPGVAQAIAAAGASLRYLPPYSPDYNPIENLWSKVKASLRTAAARTFTALGEAIDSALAAVTPEDCRGFFGNSGYVDL